MNEAEGVMCTPGKALQAAGKSPAKAWRKECPVAHQREQARGDRGRENGGGGGGSGGGEPGPDFGLDSERLGKTLEDRAAEPQDPCKGRPGCEQGVEGRARARGLGQGPGRSRAVWTKMVTIEALELVRVGLYFQGRPAGLDEGHGGGMKGHCGGKR